MKKSKFSIVVKINSENFIIIFFPVSRPSIGENVLKIIDFKFFQKSSKILGKGRRNGENLDLLFIGGQLVAVSHAEGCIGVWHSATGNWQAQAVPAPVTALDVAGSEFLLLGCQNGSIYYIDMQKFPLRNQLVVVRLSRPSGRPAGVPLG